MKSAHNFFSEDEKKHIVSAIQQAEKNTSAEIRVHIDNYCLGNPLHKAQKIFFRNNMHLTKNNNAVLFYIAVWSKKIAVLGDKGIYERVDKNLWENIIHQLIQAFQKDEKKAETLAQCILKIGNFLQKYFPADENNNPNELSNEISY